MSKLTYTWLSKSRYANQIKDLKYKDEIGLHLRDDDGGLIAECFIRWYDLNTSNLYARLEVFNDAWPMFTDAQFRQLLISGLQDCATPWDIVNWLNSMEWEDSTAYPVKKSNTGIIAEIKRLTAQIEQLTNQLNGES